MREIKYQVEKKQDREIITILGKYQGQEYFFYTHARDCWIYRWKDENSFGEMMFETPQDI